MGAESGVVVMAVEGFKIGQVFYRPGDSAAHTVLAFSVDGSRLLVRRESWGLASTFSYWMVKR